ncbi:hypothetical protein C8Q79DRAFT_887884, partial [Trametes meyenii]
FQDALPLAPSTSNIYEFSPEELVDKALHALQEAGIQLIEWKSLLHRRMGVPVIIKDYHYLVADEHLELAEKIVAHDVGLPLSLPPSLLLNTGGDFYAKARLYRLTRYTSVAQAQHLALYPASIASFAPTDLTLWPRLTSLSHPLCAKLLVPSQPAVYASILRMMRKYTRFAPTRVMLESDLSELVGYNLYGLQDGYVDTDDDELCEELEVDRRVEDAVRTVQEWRATNQLPDGSDGDSDGDGGWLANALVDIVSGKRTVEDVPWA